MEPVKHDEVKEQAVVDGSQKDLYLWRFTMLRGPATDACLILDAFKRECPEKWGEWEQRVRDRLEVAIEAKVPAKPSEEPICAYP